MQNLPSSFSPSRRRFLTGDMSNARPAVRPPWSVAEPEFHALCTRCDKCLSACPEHILQNDSAGYPRVDFFVGGCTFCGECADACEPRALVRLPERAPWVLRAIINDDCLAKRQVVCRTCGERCETGAIFFKPAAGGVAMPKLDAELCTGCGFCFADCPTKAISVQSAGVEAV